MAFTGEAQAVHGVGPAVGPLPELLRRLCEGHVGGDGAVDDGLWMMEQKFPLWTSSCLKDKLVKASARKNLQLMMWIGCI